MTYIAFLKIALPWVRSAGKSTIFRKLSVCMKSPKHAHDVSTSTTLHIHQYSADIARDNCCRHFAFSGIYSVVTCNTWQILLFPFPRFSHLSTSTTALYSSAQYSIIVLFYDIPLIFATDRICAPRCRPPYLISR